MTRAILCGCTTLLMLAGLAGCSPMLAGDWRSIEPADIPPDVARIRQISFDSNSHFHARLLQRHKISTVTGTYQLTADQLVLTPDSYAGAGQLYYTVQSLGNVLVLRRGNQTYRLAREADGSMTATPALPLPDLSTQPVAEPPATQPTAGR